MSDLIETAGARRAAEWHASSRGNHPSVASQRQFGRSLAPMRGKRALWRAIEVSESLGFGLSLLSYAAGHAA